MFVAGSAYFGDTGECAEGCRSDRVQGRRGGRHGGHQQLRRLPASTGWTPAPSTRWPSRPPGTSRWRRKAVPTAASLTLPAVVPGKGVARAGREGQRGETHGEDFEAMVRRLNDIHEIENLMGRYEFLTTANMFTETVELFAKTVPQKIEIGPLGVWDGMDAA